jgi:hypothetical protein
VAVNSRRKGKTGELEAAEVLRVLFGWTTRRTQQFAANANADSADLRVEQTPELFWEVKRVQRLNVPKTIRIAASQCDRRTPVLMHRPDRSDWLLTIRLADLPVLCHAYESAQAESVAAPQLSAAEARDSKGA